MGEVSQRVARPNGLARLCCNLWILKKMSGAWIGKMYYSSVCLILAVCESIVDPFLLLYDFHYFVAVEQEVSNGWLISYTYSPSHLYKMIHMVDWQMH
jgi:hypothetical protein